MIKLSFSAIFGLISMFAFGLPVRAADREPEPMPKLNISIPSLRLGRVKVEPDFGGKLALGLKFALEF